jgi:1-acyl-sn-glycerol-3-phosphate acyltransferase
MTKHSSQFQLLQERRFLPFFITQFLGAFNDNVYKNALVTMFVYSGIVVMGMNTDLLVNFAAVVFILPYFIFSATAGQLADKLDNARLMQYVKFAEILIMSCAVLGFYLKSPIFLLLMLFLMGTQSTFFGPVKYGYLPRVLHRSELVGGNGVTDMGTFLAILLGMIAGAHAISYANGTLVVSIILLTVAIAGYFSSRQIPATTASDPGLKLNLNIFKETWKIIQYSRVNQTIFLSVIGISWFWFVGSIIITQIPNFTRNYMYADESVFVLLMGTFSISVGIGSLLCERLSGGRVEIGLVPLGSLGLTFFTVDLFFASSHVLPKGPELYTIGEVLSHPANWRILFDIFMIGVSSGFYIVPLYALIQERCHEDHISRVIAANNIINSVFMIAAGLAAMLILGNNVSIPGLIMITGIMNLVVAIYIYRMITEFLWRFIVWVSLHTIYRVKTRGLDNIPEEGAAVLVCNHVSFVDALIIAGYTRRPVRFVMDHRIYNSKVLKPIFQMAKVIPIASKKENPELLEQAYEQINQTLDEGHLLCIFPEGAITYDGELTTFKKGIEHIIATRPVPVVPLALQGLWGSWFSRYKGKAMKGIPRHIPRVTLSAGEVISPEQVSADYLQARVAELRGVKQ